MKTEDKLYNKIKSAAQKGEMPDFPNLESVWNRVEDKLEANVSQKETSRWKKVAIAASIILVGTIAYHFYQPNESLPTEEQTIVLQDTVKIQKVIDEKSAVVTNEKNESIQPVVHPAIKPEAPAMIQEQIQLKPNAVALEEHKKAEINSEKIEISTPALYDDEVKQPSVSSEKISVATKMSLMETTSAKKRTQTTANYDKIAEEESLQSKKLAPLVLLDGQKISEKEFSKMSSTELDSIVILKEPLYIINGVEYTEQEVFGPNPTSPYSPLTEQDITSTTIYKGDDATKLYGKKGEKGVVVITTKNGKPKK